MKMMLALIATLSMSMGCATILPMGKDVCDLLIGGSKIGKLCDQLDKLEADEEEVVE